MLYFDPVGTNSLLPSTATSFGARRQFLEIVVAQLLEGQPNTRTRLPELG